jgi:hypothetical protein
VNCVKKHFKPESFVIKETDRIWHSKINVEA